MATVMVTGANRGIGLGLVKEFLKHNLTKTLVAACRTPEQAEVGFFFLIFYGELSSGTEKYQRPSSSSG